MTTLCGGGWMSIKIDQLSDAVRAELENYTDEVDEAVDRVVLRVARKCLSTIKRNSPRHMGDYRRGWAMKKERARGRVSATIYNRTRWFLIHLLEDGHQKAAGGRVEGKPHVGPAEDQAERELMAGLEQELGG